MGYFGMICLLTLVYQRRLILYCSTISQKLPTCILLLGLLLYSTIDFFVTAKCNCFQQFFK
jgi:hypothetical protein